MIIADDLTGAIDTGVQLAEQGVSTLVIPEMRSENSLDSQAIVINTETRHCTPAKAADSVAEAVALGHELGVQHFYKKTDSTLRGNLGSELQALMKATREKHLYFIPAFPRLHRTTCLGRHFVNGVEVQSSDFGRDPLNPIFTSDVASLIKQQAPVHTHHVPLGEFGRLSGVRKDGIYIFDCETETDMQSIALALRDVRPLTNLAGSAGFAPYLSSLLNLNASADRARLNIPEPMLVVNGSLNPAVQRQLDFAAHSGFVVIHLEMHKLVESHSGAAKARTDIARKIAEQLRSEHNVVLTTTSDCHSMHNSAMLSIVDRLGEVVSEIVHKAKLRLLTVFGGDTLSAVMRSLQCRQIVPIAEILPGIALSQFYVGGNDMFVISKAGGFGGVDVLPAISESLRRIRQ